VDSRHKQTYTQMPTKAHMRNILEVKANRNILWYLSSMLHTTYICNQEVYGKQLLWSFEVCCRLAALLPPFIKFCQGSHLNFFMGHGLCKGDHVDAYKKLLQLKYLNNVYLKIHKDIHPSFRPTVILNQSTSSTSTTLVKNNFYSMKFRIWNYSI